MSESPEIACKILSLQPINLRLWANLVRIMDWK